LTRLLEEEFAKSNLNGSDSIGSAILMGNSEDGTDGSDNLARLISQQSAARQMPNQVSQVKIVIGNRET
jgi:hypothetical protein